MESTHEHNFGVKMLLVVSPKNLTISGTERIVPQSNRLQICHGSREVTCECNGSRP